MAGIKTSILINQELYKKIKHFCIDKGISVSNLIEQSIEKYIENDGGKKQWKKQ